MRKMLRWFAATLVCFLGSLSAFPAAAQESVAGEPEAANGQWPMANDQIAPESPKAARVRALNNGLLRLHSQMQGASPTEGDSIRSHAATVIAQRAAALSALIERDPRAALSFAFSPELLDDLGRKFPHAASMLETHGTWQGPIEIWVADDFIQHRSVTVTKIKAGGQTLQLYFARGKPRDLQAGAPLKMGGVLVGSKLIVDDEEVR